MKFISFFSLQIFFLVTCCLGLTEELNSNSRPKKYDSAFIFYLENDSRHIGGPGSDQAYTNGFKFSYVYAEDRVPGWASPYARALRSLDYNIQGSKVNYELSLGQQIYTPNNIRTANLISEDRPYAAWLYLGLATSLKEKDVSHLFELDLGMVGPSALGREFQNGYHRMIGISPALGWDNGLHDEPTLQLFYQKRYRTYKVQNLELISYYGGAFGNVYIGAHIGGLLRLGVNLPDDFGPSRPSASDGDSFISTETASKSHPLGYYFFAGIRGNGIARNIFLDGNTFHNSHHVTKLPFGFDTEVGVGTQIFPFALVWRFVVRSPEFKEKRLYNSFAGINLVYYF